MVQAVHRSDHPARRAQLLTYRDAAEYITALPKAERDAADWQVAMETLLRVAERNGPEMLAADRDDAGAEQARSQRWHRT